MQSVSVLPLHGGRAPRWLFPRMVKLGGMIANAVIEEYGTSELLSRLSSPYWFQALACAIGYDWHSSGATTVTMGALKEALNFRSDVFIAGGKGSVGTSSPEQIEKGADYLSIPSRADGFVRMSRMSAKIDSALVYDDIGIYHHTFLFAKDGAWCVVQQAMHNASGNAIRFQVDGSRVDPHDITKETNSGVFAARSSPTIDLTNGDNSGLKQASLDLVNDDIQALESFDSRVYSLPKRHAIRDADLSPRARRLLAGISDMRPESYEELLGMKGVGRKTLRSLAMIASLVYRTEIYERDPILYAYNVGGKDGIPYPINVNEYDRVISSMGELVKGSSMGQDDERHALRRLSGELSRAYACAWAGAAQKGL